MARRQFRRWIRQLQNLLNRTSTHQSKHADKRPEKWVVEKRCHFITLFLYQNYTAYMRSAAVQY
jgi:hypothetical protein